MNDFLFDASYFGSRRLARFKDLQSNGEVLVEAEDGGKPARFSLSVQEFPWNRFALFLTNAWLHSTPVPRYFRPLRRIPDEVIAQLQNCDSNSAREILHSLRVNGFFPPIRASKATAYGIGRPQNSGHRGRP